MWFQRAMSMNSATPSPRGRHGESVPFHVLVATTREPVDRSKLIPAVLQAAVEQFGVRWVEDIAPGAAGSVLLVLDGAVRIQGRPTWRLARSMERALRLPRRSVLVRDFKWAHDDTGMLDDAIAHWTDHLREESAVTAERLAFHQAVSDLLSAQRLRTVFQPIVDVVASHVVGYEALTRGPLGHSLESPAALIDAAQRCGLDRELDWEMFQLASSRAVNALPGDDALLFLNVGAHDVWTGHHLRELDAAQDRFPWNHVVLELNERMPFPDVDTFRSVRGAAREHGLRFALDDVGAGYAGLAALALVEPEFVKIDLGLIRDCDQDVVRQTIVRSLVHFADDTGSRVIAEGVETLAELETLQALGVRLVQGYLTGPPTEVPSGAVEPVWGRATGSSAGTQNTAAIRGVSVDRFTPRG
jgi:EAL domain-containing protein (putative c-di-GMP-specific phosphodiesterase class I)